MFCEHDFRCREQTRLLPGPESKRCVGEALARLHLNDRQKVGRGGDDVDLAGLGAETTGQDDKSIALENAASSRLGINAALIGSCHVGHRALRIANAG
jgi:hypothetical protein